MEIDRVKVYGFQNHIVSDLLEDRYPLPEHKTIEK